jgi:hypothetical protein
MTPTHQKHPGDSLKAPHHNSMVARTGFEPVYSSLWGLRVTRLLYLAIGVATTLSSVLWENELMWLPKQNNEIEIRYRNVKDSWQFRVLLRLVICLLNGNVP